LSPEDRGTIGRLADAGILVEGYSVQQAISYIMRWRRGLRDFSCRRWNVYGEMPKQRHISLAFSP